VHNNGIPHPYALYRVADRLDPTGIFVSERVRQLDLDLLPPNTLNNVQVGAAQSSAANANNNLVVPVQAGLIDTVEFQWLIIGV
jgi:hypothetical protein